MKSIISITLFILLCLATTLELKAATITVTNTNDSGTGSLRQAISDANVTTDTDTIEFSAFFNTSKTIVLTGGEINITNSLTINGTGTNLLTISGNNQSRIFFNNYGSSTLEINNLTLAQGLAPNGGAVFASSFLKLSNLVITNNRAMGDAPSGSQIGLGGGIYSTGSLTLVNSVISNNLASGIIFQYANGAYGTSGGGGGIYSSDATISNCSFTGNTARGISSPASEGEQQSGTYGGNALGGAIYSTYGLKITNSTFANNSAIAGNGGSVSSTTFNKTGGNGGEAVGGAINTSGAKILNSTFVNNTATGGNGGTAPIVEAVGNGGRAVGGAIYDRSLNVVNSTVVSNSVTSGSGRTGGTSIGGGIYVGDHFWSITDSTITGNSASGGLGTQASGLIQGGGVFREPNSDQSSNYFRNNIVGENTAADGTDVFGGFLNAANNLIRIGEGSSGIINGVDGNVVGYVASPINLMLADLADNGGVTKTRALLAGSPAINAGNNSFAINPITSQPLQFDQRNFQRIVPSGGTIDIGAYELGASTVPVTANPDLQSASDTGLSDTDNITKATAPIFNILNVISGAKVELLRNNVVIASGDAASTNLFLTDSNPPLDGIVQYTSRQTIGGVTSAVSDALTVTFDHTAPTVTINQSSQQSDPGTSQPILFTAQFSERVSGFDFQDVSLAGSTADVSSASVYVNATSPSTYSIEVNGIRSAGKIVITIPTAAAYDYVINYTTAPTYVDNSVDYQPSLVGVNVLGRIRRNSALIRVPSTITLTDNATGESWSTRTNNFGYYRFLNLPIYQQIGRKFAVRIDNKNFNFVAPQQVMIYGNVNNLNYLVP